MAMATQARAGTPQPMMTRMGAVPPGPSRGSAPPRPGYGMSPQGTPVNRSPSSDVSGRMAGSRQAGGGGTIPNSLNNSPKPNPYFQLNVNVSPITNNFLPQYASGGSSAPPFQMQQYQGSPCLRQPSQQPQGAMLPPRPPNAAMASNGGGGRFHENQPSPQAPGGARGGQGYPSWQPSNSPGMLSHNGDSGARHSLVAPQQPMQQYPSDNQSPRSRPLSHPQAQPNPMMPRPPQGPPQGGPRNRPSSANVNRLQGPSSSWPQPYMGQPGGAGRGLYGRKPVARGPQPTDVTPTRGLDGRRLKDNRPKPAVDPSKPPPRLSPQLNGKRGKVTPQGEVVHKIKTTVDNDESWVQPLVYSTWVDSPTQSFAGGGANGGHYKREPNKRTRKDAAKAREKAKKGNHHSNTHQDSSDEELSSGGLSSSSSQHPKKSKFVQALRGLFR